MEVEVADEVEDHLLPPPYLLRELVTLGRNDTFVHGEFGNEILRTCVSCFCVSKKLSLIKFEVTMCRL